jgi:hypothetical protein
MTRVKGIKLRNAHAGLRAAAIGLLLAGFSMVLAVRPLAAAGGAPDEHPFAGNNCVECHADLPGRSSHIVELEWKPSVHFAAGVGCDGCHGGDPTLRREQFGSEEAFKRAAHRERNPEFLVMHQEGQFVSAARGRSVSYFCGKCHSTIKEQHLGSPHGEFGDPTCLYCHGQGSHLITAATPGIIDTRPRSEGGRCTACHVAGTMEAVSRIKQVLIDTEEQIITSGEQYAELEEWGYRNLELEKLHYHAAEVRSQLRQIFHSFNMRDINNFAGEILMAVERTSDTHSMIERLRQTQRRQMVVGGVAVLLLLSFAGLLLYYKRTFLEAGHAAVPPKPGAAKAEPKTASPPTEARAKLRTPEPAKVK